MKIYRAEIHLGKIRINSTDVISEEQNFYKVCGANDIQWGQNMIHKSNVAFSEREAVDLLAQESRKGIKSDTNSVAAHVRNIDRCWEWIIEREQTEEKLEA